MTARSPFSCLMQSPCSTLILAGGRGQRMGGRDKGLIEWKGEPLVAHVQRVVRPLSDDLVISCNRNQEAYRAYADQLVGDAEAGFPGPLAGVIAGLKVARHEWVVLLACDAPQVDRVLIEDLLRLAVASDSAAMVRQGGIGSRCSACCHGGCCRCWSRHGQRVSGVCRRPCCAM